MKTLEDFIVGLQKDYRFRVRFLFEVTDEMVEKLEKRLEKYDVAEITQPEKTIFLKHSIGWTGPINSEVWVIDVAVLLPVSANHLQHEIANLFRVPVEKISVMTDQQEELEDLLKNQSKEPREGALIDDPDYSEIPGIDHSDYYGDEYNKKMMDTIEKSKDDILDKIFNGNYK